MRAPLLLLLTLLIVNTAANRQDKAKNAFTMFIDFPL